MGKNKSNSVISFLRKKRDLTQQELADKIGMNRSILSAIENGLLDNMLDVYLKISRVLDCKVTDLYNQEGINNKSKKNLKL